MPFTCATCGQIHDSLPDLGFRWPDSYFGVPAPERASRIRGDADTCEIDGEEFFIRGVILIPIIGTSEHFGLGVWVSQKRENYQAYRNNFDSPNIGPFFGWLSNNIPFYQPDTWAMKTMAHFQGGKQRPLIELAPSEHPLYLDFSQGVSLERAWHIVHAQSSSRIDSLPS
jgi:hypothetical protein